MAFGNTAKCNELGIWFSSKMIIMQTS